MEFLPCFYILPRDMQHDFIIYSRLCATRVTAPWLIACATALLGYLHCESLRFSGGRHCLGCPTMCKAHVSMLPYYFSHILTGLLHLLPLAPVSLGPRSDVTCDFAHTLPPTQHVGPSRVRNEWMHLSCSDAQCTPLPSVISTALESWLVWNSFVFAASSRTAALPW